MIVELKQWERIKKIEGQEAIVKTVLEATNRSLMAQYVTKNAAPRNIYATKLKQNFRKGHIDNFFTYSGSYINAPENEYDVLIVDKAHRLN